MSNILTPAQISYYAQSAGFTGQALITAVAIALAESSGNASVYNPETAAGAPPGGGSYGLWQIYLNDHPEYAGVNLYDPQTNANAAFALYSAAGGFTPWTTYNSGAYQAYLIPASSVAPPIPGLTAAAGASPGGGTSILTIPSATLPAAGGFSWGGAALIVGAILGIGLALEEI
ncbi:MAG: transglycosylase SLT domain-containing protein [Candidatus Acidiferrales bacterium]